MTDSAFAERSRSGLTISHDRALTATTLGGLLSVDDVIANVRKATWPRIGFAAVMALLSLAVLPALFAAAAWLAFIAAWELAIRIFIEDRLRSPAARAFCSRRAFNWLAADSLRRRRGVHVVPGACVVDGRCDRHGAGDGVDLRLGQPRLCLLHAEPAVADGVPRAAGGVCAGGAVHGGGLHPARGRGVSTLAALMLSAGMFGFDRRVLHGHAGKARGGARSGGASQHREIAISGDDEPRTAHAAQRRHRLRGADRGRSRTRDRSQKTPPRSAPRRGSCSASSM